MTRPRRRRWRAATLAALAAAVGAAALVACGDRSRPEQQEARVRPVVDSLLPRLEYLSGLRAVRPIRIGYRTRAQVREYVVRQLDRDLPPPELGGIQATYSTLGLIPDTLDLRALLIDLYTEQVGGYYDPETKTFYTVEGTPRSALRTVLAHELVHALQDQHVNLDSLVARERGNDRQTAAQAAVEGQATAVMVVVLADRAAHHPVDPAQLPDLGEQLAPAIEEQNTQFPVYARAPRIIRETLVFPYLQGAAFVQELWRDRAAGGPPKNGWPAPLDSLLPQSTEQVMHPDRFVEARDTPTELRLGRTPPSPSGWRTRYENTLGELETTIFLEQFLGDSATADGWDGDRFRLLEGPGNARALVWYSVWDRAAAADTFAADYRRVLARRPARRARVERLEVRGRPVVRVVDVPVGIEFDAVPVPGVDSLVER
ncbi:MAG TPA: hypothetical protein VFQ38_15965 [Longimicrobiales bacterium]|nr:hypothetical protein [Longimicrobiales bacterium]